MLELQKTSIHTLPSRKAKNDLRADDLPASELRKRHRGGDPIPDDSDSDDSDVVHKKARRDDADDEEHQNGPEDLPAASAGEDVHEDEQQQQAAGPFDDVDDRVSMAQRLCTGIDTQLQALNENLSNPESTLTAALSKAATTAMRHSLEDAPVKRLQQEISQCKQLLVRKQQNFDELHRSSQQEQNEQAIILQYAQNKVAGLSKQLQDERDKLDKVSAGLQTEQTKCAEIQKQLEEEKTKILGVIEGMQANFGMRRASFSRPLAFREEQERNSGLSRDLAAERRQNGEEVEWPICMLTSNLSKINFKRSHPKELDSYSKIDMISTIAKPLLTPVGTALLDFFLDYSQPGVIYCFTHAVVDEDEESPPFKHGQCPLHLAGERIDDCVPVLCQEDPVEEKSFVFLRLDVAIEMTGGRMVSVSP
ncbi:r27-2 protein [Colletotrichum kahawae]|uniref:R27-2 protein n=1 Tax=Colletotrichum kahawae TaxID=34407 RepID=A0AAD9Y1S9_COLKA|nr:r27-2 protein [Colletotrichum kahawae]